MKNSILTIPNLLSLFRLCIIPFITTTYSRGWFLAATLLLVLSGVTDMLDGCIARRFHQISEFGKIIDPLADKLTMAAVVFALLLRHPQMWMVMVVLVLKESAMLIGAYLLLRRGTRPSESKIFGKISTAVLYLVFFSIMVTDIIEGITGRQVLPVWAVWVMSGVCSLCMIAALVQYYPIFKGIQSGTYNIETEQFEGDTTQ